MNGVNSVDNISRINAKTDAEREAQRLYWTEHSVETTVEAMMLDSQAKAIDLQERPEVCDCSELPSDVHSLDHISLPFCNTALHWTSVVVERGGFL